MPLMRPDNSHYLRAAARQRSEEAQARVTKALEEMDKAGGPATIAALARAARVSRSWLYTQPDLLAQLQEQAHAPRTSPTGPSTRSSGDSLHRRLQLAHQRIRQLTDENQQLHERLARAHGALRLATRTNGNPLIEDQ